MLYPDGSTFEQGQTPGRPIMGYDSDSGELVVVGVNPGTRELLTSGGGGGGGGTSSAFGAIFPADGTAIGLERGGNMVALVEGQAVMASSVPVVIASDQSAIPVTSSVPTSNTATDPTQTTVGTSAATALAAGTRKAMSIQNQGTTIIYLLLGAGTPTSSKYTVALPACGTANDGSSAPYTGPPGVVWTGAVQWISSAGGGLATAVELT